MEPGHPPVPRRVYLDGAHAAPLLPQAREALLAALDDGWADPRRLHREGRNARMLLDGAREEVASRIGARTEEVSFAPSHALAVHAAVLGTAAARRRTGSRVVVSAVEHSAVLQAAAHATGDVVRVPVDRQGRAETAGYASALAEAPTALTCLQSANGEVGTLQPVGEVAEAARRAGVPLLVDATASIGQLSPPVGWDLLVADARAWGGPGGVGVLAVRAGTRWRSPAPEHDGLERVPGEVSVPAALAAAVALQAADRDREAEAARRHALVDRIRDRAAACPDVEVLGDPTARLPHVVTFSCLQVDGEALVGELDRAGFAVGSGSACTSSTLRPSHVLAAMGVLTHGNVRIGLPHGTAGPDVDAFCAALPEALTRVRALLAPAPRPADSGDTSDRGSVTVDARGLHCPLPVIRLAEAAAGLPPGAMVRVLSTDPAARPDIAAWCRMRGHRLLGQREGPPVDSPVLVSTLRLERPAGGTPSAAEG